ncbi:hypothetical protein NQZ68_001110 [Dissostichus eleginoides]|nr:hypothetical protein NQZ68_001110 [Dissostichus eleginoides]
MKVNVLTQEQHKKHSLSFKSEKYEYKRLLKDSKRAGCWHYRGSIVPAAYLFLTTEGPAFETWINKDGNFTRVDDVLPAEPPNKTVGQSSFADFDCDSEIPPIAGFDIYYGDFD